MSYPMSTDIETPIEQLEESPSLSGDEREDTVEREKLLEEATQLPLERVWVLWSHELRNKSWTIDSYQKICTLETVADTVQFLNTFPKMDLKSYHYFLMREGVQPTWEDPHNRHGGVCSFRTEIVPMAQKKDLSVVNVWNYLVMRLAGETCHEEMDDMTGLSVSPKNNWAIIKLWNSTASNKLSQTLPPDILKKYGNLSIKYKANSPEY